jgi:hypothetical protein
VNAANGSTIDIEGEAIVDVVVEGYRVKTRFLVSPNIRDRILGIDWLSDNNVTWSFNGQEISISGHRIALHSK